LVAGWQRRRQSYETVKSDAEQRGPSSFPPLGFYRGQGATCELGSAPASEHQASLPMPHYRFGTLLGSVSFMQSQLPQLQSRQLDVVARMTPYAMAGHMLNATILAVAVAGSIPTIQLIIWSSYSYAVALLLLYRNAKNRARVPQSFRRATHKATAYAFLLALPWSSMAVLHLGTLAQGEQLILIALGVGMAASGTLLLWAMPAAAFSYMSGILIPTALKCLVLDQKAYLLLGALALSYWGFLAALIGMLGRADEHSRSPSRDTVMSLTAEQRRALAVLAGAGLDGTSQALLMAQGFTASMIAGLVNRGLATLTYKKIRIGGNLVKIAKVRITALGSEALAVEERFTGPNL